MQPLFLNIIPICEPVTYNNPKNLNHSPNFESSNFNSVHILQPMYLNPFQFRAIGVCSSYVFWGNPCNLDVIARYYTTCTSWKLPEETLDHTLWISRFGKGYGSVIRQKTERMNVQIIQLYSMYLYGATRRNDSDPLRYLCLCVLVLDFC